MNFIIYIYILPQLEHRISFTIQKFALSYASFIIAFPPLNLENTVLFSNIIFLTVKTNPTLFIGLGPHPAVCRTFSWLCAQRSAMVDLGEPYTLLRIITELVACKSHGLSYLYSDL